MLRLKEFSHISEHDYNSRGLYRVTIAHHSYVGSSNFNMGDRLRTHRNEMVKDRHHNAFMQRSFNKYGMESCSFDVICVMNDHIEREIREAERVEIASGNYDMNMSALPLMAGGGVLIKEDIIAVVEEFVREPRGSKLLAKSFDFGIARAREVICTDRFDHHLTDDQIRMKNNCHELRHTTKIGVIRKAVWCRANAPESVTDLAIQRHFNLNRSVFTGAKIRFGSHWHQMYEPLTESVDDLHKIVDTQYGSHDMGVVKYMERMSKNRTWNMEVVGYTTGKYNVLRGHIDLLKSQRWCVQEVPIYLPADYPPVKKRPNKGRPSVKSI